MRKEYDFSRALRRRVSSGGRRRSPAEGVGKTSDRGNLHEEPLSQRQVRELRRRVADLDDPTRYLLVSRFDQKFALYYNVSDDVYAMNDPRAATLFKRRRAALAVKGLLGPRVQVIRCTTRREKGTRIPVLGKGPQRVKKRAK